MDREKDFPCTSGDACPALPIGMESCNRSEYCKPYQIWLVGNSPLKKSYIYTLNGWVLREKFRQSRYA